MELRMPTPPPGYMWELSAAMPSPVGECIEVALLNQRGKAVETSYAFDTEGPWPKAITRAARTCLDRHKLHAASQGTAAEFLKNATITY